MEAQASKRAVGYGLEPDVEMGPVITAASKQRILGLIEQGLAEGGSLVHDGRAATIQGYERGHFLRPTVLADLPPQSELAQTEIFGPVLTVLHTDSIDQALALANSGRFGNMACLFSSSGAAARRIRYEAEIGNLGINIGVAAPMWPSSPSAVGGRASLATYTVRGATPSPSSPSRR